MELLIPLILIALALSGTPLFIIIATSALIGFYSEEIDLSVIAIEFYRLAEIPMLLAIPLFTFSGYLLSESGAPQRLVRLTQAVLGWMPGGLAIVCLCACALFTAFTGASGVAIAALGALLFPALMQAGYRENFNLGLITSSGSLGVLFAPSLPIILYGVISQQLGLGEPFSIDDLFLAGILPGILMIVVMSGWSIWQGRTLPVTPYSNQALISAIKESKWEIPLPFIVLGGIYSGYFAVSEAAAVTVVYIFIVEVLINRDIKLKQLPGIMHESMVLIGAILVILGVSMASTNYMIDAEIPMQIFDKIQEMVDSPQTFVFLLVLFLLLLGTILDIFSAIVIMVPIILPIALEYNVHPIHLGIIFLATMQIGYFTPPVGMNLFIASHRFRKPVMQLYRATLPFFILLLLAVLIITYFPALSLTLPNAFG